MWTAGGQIDHITFAGVYGGGGKAAAPVMPAAAPAPATPIYADPVTGKTYETPAALNTGIDTRTADDKATSDAKAKADEDARVKAHTDWVGKRDAAITNERAALEDAYRKQGVDPALYKTNIDAAMKTYTDRIKDDDPNVASVYPTDLGGQIVNDSVATRRNTATNSYNALFDPNYSKTALKDDLLTPHVEALLNEQFNPLSTQLENAKKRGTLTDVGYQGALDSLGARRTAGAATIRDLGSTILGNSRKSVDDYITEGRNAAGALNLSGSFDPQSYRTTADSMIKSSTDNLGGALRSSVGGTKFADLTELLNAGGSVQGTTNPTAANPMPGGSVGLGQTIIDDTKKRDLGSVGAF